MNGMSVIASPPTIFGGRRNLGFSLVEVMVVAAVIGGLAAAMTLGLSRYRQNSEDVRTQGELASIYKAMEAYRQVYGRYPAGYGQLSQFISIPDFDSRYEINPNP